MKIYKRYLKRVTLRPLVFCEADEATTVADLTEAEVRYNETAERNFYRSQEYLQRKETQWLKKLSLIEEQ